MTRIRGDGLSPAPVAENSLPYDILQSVRSTWRQRLLPVLLLALGVATLVVGTLRDQWSRVHHLSTSI